MSQKLYTESDIQNIADAIRYKNGSSDTYRVSDMPTAIRAIPTGGGSGLPIKSIEWDGVDGLSKDIEIPLSDINCIVLGINGVSIQAGHEGEVTDAQGGSFMWGQTSIPYLNETTYTYVDTASYPQSNILRLAGSGQSPAENFNLSSIHYTMLYIVLPEIT